MSTIYIHPTATHNMNSLVALKQATGLTITRGVRYLRLEPGEDKPAPASKTVVVSARRVGKTNAVSSYLQGPVPVITPKEQRGFVPSGPFHPGGGDAA